jgi:hypothetical protein
LELLRRAREDVGGESGPADLSGGAAAVVRSYETRLGGLIADFERRRGVLEEALDRYQSGRGEGDGEAESAAVRAALSLRGARRRLFEATARFEREVTASLRPELAAAFRSGVAEASADGSGPALLSGGGADLTRFERMVRRLEGGRVGLSASQRRAVEGIDAERAEAREGVLRSFAPVVERWRAERAAEEAEDGGGGEGSSFEVRFTNGAIRLERVGAGGSSAGDRSEEDAEEGVDRDERRRLAVRLYEIEQEAVDALRALLSEEQRSAIVE